MFNRGVRSRHNLKQIGTYWDIEYLNLQRLIFGELKLSEKNSFRFVRFGANLNQFVPTSDVSAGGCWCLEGGVWWNWSNVILCNPEISDMSTTSPVSSSSDRYRTFFF